MTPATPIACSLEQGAFASRLEWIRAINDSALRSHRLEGRSLELTYDRAFESAVHELVAREKQCCGFLEFSVRDTVHAVELRITAPEEADGLLTEIFAPFLTGSSTTTLSAPA